MQAFVLLPSRLPGAPYYFLYNNALTNTTAPPLRPEFCIFAPMWRFRILLLTLSISAAPSVFAASFDFNESCKKAYENLVALRINTGKQELNQELAAHPANLAPVMLDNYSDFFPLFFNEDASQWEACKTRMSQRLDKLEKGPDNDPYFRYSKGIVYFQRCAMRIKFGEYFRAATDFRTAYQLFKDNNSKFPNFYYNLPYLGAMEAIAGTVPDGYKWVAGVLGIKGNVDQGIAKLETGINKAIQLNQWNKCEALFLFVYAQKYLGNNPERAWQLINKAGIATRNNLLMTFMQANLSLNNHQAAKTVQVIRNFEDGNTYLNVPMMDYELGSALLYHLDFGAEPYLLAFTKGFKGKFYVKDAYKKLSTLAYLQGNIAKANQYKQLVISKGNTETDADKQALRFAKLPAYPNALLLKTGLLCDGGYYADALQLVAGKSSTSFTTNAEKTEFSYRLGRIYDLMGQDDKAIPYYLTTIKTGENQPEHFAARAALEVGAIYERQHNNTLALAFYRRCLAMHGHDYKNSLDQRAKAAINRISQN